MAGVPVWFEWIRDLAQAVSIRIIAAPLKEVTGRVVESPVVGQQCPDRQSRPQIVVACRTGILFAYGIIFAGRSFWTLFVGAVPLTVIVLIVFNGIWGKRKYTFILISVLIWSLITTIYLVFLIAPSHYNLWAIFIIGIPLQIATILWSQLKKS